MFRHFTLALVVCLAGFSSRAMGQTCTSTVETVARQVGETVVFCGTPSEIHLPSRPDGPINVNFGGTYPDQVFAVVIFPDVAGDDMQGLVKRLTGKRVRVSGLVKTYKGKPEIILKAMDDLEVQE